MQNVYEWAGRTVMWIGPQSGVNNWSVGGMAAAARRMRGLGIDTISPKRAEGMVKWYGTPAQLHAERQATLDQGCGFIPHFYSDGPKYGLDFVNAECAVLHEMLDVCGSVLIDMEVEWDGAVAAAVRFAELMKGHSGLLYLNSWADPQQQNWVDVAKALDPVADAWVPMDYNDWLAAQVAQQAGAGMTHIQPGIDLSQEFGQNNARGIAQSARAAGEPTIWIWEYGFALQNPQLVRDIVTIMGAPVPAPQPTPNPPPPTTHTYTVQAGDTLASIAARYHVPLSSLEEVNKVVIAAACVAHGVEFSFDDIWPGEVLTIPTA